MHPRRRPPLFTPAPTASLSEVVGRDAGWATATGMHRARRAAPWSAVSLGALPDPLSIVHDEDGDAPRVALV